MYQIIIEDEGAYQFCRSGRFINEEVAWSVTSPWLLEKLRSSNEKLHSLEEGFTLNQQKELGYLSMHLGDLLSETLDNLFDNASANLSFGKALRHRMHYTLFTLLYKAMLLEHWYNKYSDRKKLVVVGNSFLTPIKDFDIVPGRFDNLFSGIVENSNIDTIESLSYSQKDGQYVLDEIERKNNVRTHEKILYALNNLTFPMFIKLYLRKLFNYKGNLENRFFPISKNKTNDHIVYIKKCPLLDETVKYLKNEFSINYKNKFINEIEPVSEKLPFSNSELSNSINSVFKEHQTISGSFNKAAINIFSNRLYHALGYGYGFFKNQTKIFSKFNIDKSKRLSVVTNGLSHPKERLFHQKLINEEIKIFSFEHGITAGIDGVTSQNYFGNNLYTDGNDHLICYNNTSYEALNRKRKENKGIVAGAPYSNKKIKYYGVQRFIGRNYLKAKKNDRIIFYLGLLSRNNMMEPPFQINDLEYFNITNNMIFNVLGKIKDKCVLKLYPSNRYLDPDPWLALKKSPENLTVIQYFEYSELRVAADLTIVSSSASTFGWVWSTKKPIIFLEFPSKPLLKEVVQLFNNALFRIDGSKKNWQREMINILKLPHKELLKLWAEKKDAREELERHIFGPKGNSGKRASDYIAMKIL